MVGHLGRDPEIKFTDKGSAVCNFSMATSVGYGENKKTDWHRIVAWDNERNKLATRCSERLAKGSLAFVRGRIQYREYETKDGTKKQATEIVAFDVQFMDKAPAQETTAEPRTPKQIEMF